MSEFRCMCQFTNINAIFNSVSVSLNGNQRMLRVVLLRVLRHEIMTSPTRALAQCFIMMTSNGNIFCVTGTLCGEFTGPGEFPAQRPVKRSFDVFFDLSLNKRLSKHSWGWWFEMQSRPLWRYFNVPMFCAMIGHIALVAITGTTTIWLLPCCSICQSSPCNVFEDMLPVDLIHG